MKSGTWAVVYVVHCASGKDAMGKLWFAHSIFCFKATTHLVCQYSIIRNRQSQFIKFLYKATFFCLCMYLGANVNWQWSVVW